eukprot:TRINITY_DN10770_c0_g1_i1.p1 TRINITY_DN10770_c0_g1~~TRINITY_DN10770_c0_g1_i1.p1  ORF type:complete len:142 (-),score=20.85 TRINITY_DN10770_c0_g1_i1:1-363(-)
MTSSQRPPQENLEEENSRLWNLLSMQSAKSPHHETTPVHQYTREHVPLQQTRTSYASPSRPSMSRSLLESQRKEQMRSVERPVHRPATNLTASQRLDRLAASLDARLHEAEQRLARHHFH